MFILYVRLQYGTPEVLDYQTRIRPLSVIVCHIPQLHKSFFRPELPTTRTYLPPLEVLFETSDPFLSLFHFTNKITTAVPN